MGDRPILFSAPMVRALLAGTKTQTRRIIKPRRHCSLFDGTWSDSYVLDPGNAEWRERELAYHVGDRLWVREGHALLPRTAYRMSIGTGTIAQREHPTDGYTAAVFREGFDRSGRPRWRPSIHMPRWASRLTLTVTDVRVERLQDISETDAGAEGVKTWVAALAGDPKVSVADVEAMISRTGEGSMRAGYAALWEAINGPGTWEANPWVTAHTKGNHVDWAKYFEWLEPRLGHPHWAIVPDVIDGDVERQRGLVAQWPFASELGAPVWHMGLPVSYLLDLSQHWPRICFGSSGRYWQVGSDEWARRADEAFNELEKRGLRPWVHMLRGLALCGDRWPFASADSVNVARNFKDSNADPERMARRIDAIQCPIRWVIKPEQEDMFA